MDPREVRLGAPSRVSFLSSARCWRRALALARLWVLRGVVGCPGVCATVRVLARARGSRGRTCALPPRVLVFVRTRVRACVSTHSCAGACMRMDGYVIRRSPSVQSVLNVVTESLESYFYIQVHS